MTTQKGGRRVTPPAQPEPTGSFDPWLAKLYDLELDPDPKKRVESARSILRMLAAAVATGAPIPAPFRAWLARCLRESAETGNANRAFRLQPGRGNFARYPEHMNDAAQVHAAMHWWSLGLQAAADEVASLPGRLDASNLVKHHGNTKRRWRTSGPFVAGPDGYPSTTLATAEDLAAGREVLVVFTSKLTDSHWYALRLPNDVADLIPAEPARDRRK